MEFDTGISNLGPAKIPTTIVNNRSVDDSKQLTLSMTSDEFSELDEMM